MKYLIALSFLSASLFCSAQSTADQAYTLDPTTSKIIGGFFAFNGQEISSNTRNGSHSISIGPYFSLQRSEKKDILLVTNLLYQNTSNNRRERTNSLSGTVGVDFRHQLYKFNRFKVFGSYGPRIGVDLQEFSGETNTGFNLAASGNVSLAFELSPNIRLLTSAFSGIIQYNRTVDDFNIFTYRIRNTILSPNFSIEYILPRKV